MLTDARSGSGGCVLVSGPPGIGKTRLTQEATREAAGTDVLWGRAVDDPGAPPLWPWRRILRLLPTAAVDAALTGSDASREHGVDLDAARFRAFAAATDALIEAAEPRGLVVVLEDLHWADAASLRLLRHVAGEAGHSRLLIVGTHRDTGSSTLDSVLPELLRLPAVRALALPPLAETDVRAYLAAYGGPLGPDAVHGIHRRSGGNPLYLRAVTALPDPTGSGAHRAGGAAELRHLVQTTLQGLTPADQELLDAAAVLGEEVDCAVLATISRRPLDEVVRSADEAVRKGVLTTVPYGAGLRRFAHAVVRDEIYAALHAGARERLHRRAAEVLEERHGSDPLSAGVIAGHWLRSADDRDSLLRAAGWAVAASVAATRSLAFDEATTFLTMALDARDRAGSPPEERAELMLELATAEFRSGRFAASLQHASLAAEAAQAAGRRDLVAAAALVVHDVGADDLLPTMARLCDLALDVDDDAPTMRARLLAQRASIAADLGQVDDAGRLCEQALRLAEQCGDTAALLDAVRARLKLGFVGVDVEERLRLGALAIDLGGRGGQPLTALWGHQWRIEAALEVGTMAAVEVELAAVKALAAGTRLPLLRWHDLRLQASVDALLGRFDRARELNAEALRVASTALADDASAVGICQAFTLQLAMVTGDTTEVTAAHWELLSTRAQSIPIVLVSQPLMLLLLGRPDEAHALYEHLLPALETPGFLTSVAGVPNNLVPLVTEFADVETAATLLDHLSQHPPIAAAGSGVFCHGSSFRNLATLSLLLGQFYAAVGYFETALAVNTRIGARPEVVLTRLGLAEALMGRSGPADVQRAGGQAREAAEEARRLGMPGPLARATAVLEQLRVGRRSADPLTLREREVVGLVAKALSDREIAQTLVLSERTVESHVRSILAKLGMANRTEIATRAATPKR